MPKYTVDAAFWHNGNLLPVGSPVTMTEAEAKYRGHALSLLGAASAAPSEAKEAPAPEPAASVAPGVSTLERHPVAKKRHFRTDVANDDSAN